jgi:hypothetical protein
MDKLNNSTDDDNYDDNDVVTSSMNKSMNNEAQNIADPKICQQLVLYCF